MDTFSHKFTSKHGEDNEITVNGRLRDAQIIVKFGEISVIISEKDEKNGNYSTVVIMSQKDNLINYLFQISHTRNFFENAETFPDCGL